MPSRDGLDYGMLQGRVHLPRTPLEQLQQDLLGDANTTRDARIELDRILRTNEESFVRYSHSSQIRYSLGQQLRALTDRTLSQAENRFAQLQVDRVRISLIRSGVWEKISAPAGVAITALSVVLARPIIIPIRGGWKLALVTHLEAAAGGLSVNSPWFSASVNVASRAPDVRDPSVPLASGASAAEKIQISFGQQIPLLKIDTGLSFASTTGTLSAGMSRELLVPNLRGSVATTRSVRSTRVGNYGEETLNLTYGMSF